MMSSSFAAVDCQNSPGAAQAQADSLPVEARQPLAARIRDRARPGQAVPWEAAADSLADQQVGAVAASRFACQTRETHPRMGEARRHTAAEPRVVAALLAALESVDSRQPRCLHLAREGFVYLP